MAIIYRNLAGYSGVPNIVCMQASKLLEYGYKVDLIAERIDRNRFDLNKMKFIKVMRLPFFRNHRARWFSERADRISAKGYDFVAGHGHNTRQDVLSLHNCARLYYERIPNEAPVVRPDVLMQDKIFAENAFQFCIANSVLMRDELDRRYRLAGEKVRVVYPGYDPDRFNTGNHDDYRAATRKNWGIAQQNFLIGLVASGAFRLRGVDIAIDAFSRLKKSIRENIRMVIVGDNSSLVDYKRRVSALKLSEQIIFHPATREIERCYHALDVLVHPARLETFGLVVQEAMACGIPVISSRQVGATELLPLEAQAELADSPDAEDLVEKLEKMICDQQFRQRWIEYSKSAIAGNSEQNYFSKILDIYREAGL
jgi:UDP-glucose:(heptosyl)LPS alpha-1,3-glucosyltransferase